jgi:MFS superfamily sulfate permease-like transporter
VATITGWVGSALKPSNDRGVLSAPGEKPQGAEKPQNGLAGLKHWRYDLRSGFMVAMISLPFSMGIAITSGAPPVCGIVSAIIAGFLLPFLGGSYVTISGPAAGLAPALFAGMIMLGGVQLGRGAGHDEVLKAGYPLVLVAICLAGLLQVVLAKMKVARLSAIFPAGAIEGMLAAIGLMIIAKQIPLFMGVKFEAHEFWAILREAPRHFATMNLQVFGLGVACLATLFVLAAVPGRLFKVMPPPVWVFVFGTLSSLLFLHLDSRYLIHVPEAPLKHGVVLPNFAAALSNAGLWLPLAYIVFTLLLIDGTESLATIAAVDKIDPYRRRSDPDRTLNAMGVSNMCSSLLGGLTIIPGIVKSTANIIGGGRTQWANFFNACFLLAFLIFARGLINLVPMAVLASILVFIGFKLCRAKVWMKVAAVGSEQLLIFTVTVLVTVTTDLLIGIAAGIALELALSLWYVSLWHTLRDASLGIAKPSLAARFLSLFRNPVTRRELDGGAYHLYVDGPLVCFNMFHMMREVRNRPDGVRSMHIHLSSHVPLVDHTTCDTLQQYLEEFNANGEGPSLSIEGWDRMLPLSKHEASMRIALVAGESLIGTARAEAELHAAQALD